MPFVRAGQIARPTPVLAAEMPLGLVAENLRVAGCGALPVLDRLITGGTEDGPGGFQWQAQARQARVVGLVDERDLSSAVLPVLEAREYARREMIVTAGAATNHAPLWNGSLPENGVIAPNGTSFSNGAILPEELNAEESPTYLPLGDLTQMTARDVMRPDFGIVPALFSLHNALITLDRFNCNALPVIEVDGTYRGMISRADIVAALGRNIRPPVIGGMATPLGVWLTTGALSGGAPPLGLFLSGVVLGLCHMLSYFVVLIALGLINVDWAAMFASGRMGGTVDSGAFNFVTTAAQSLVFLCFIRALPLSGIHAAEHQTVWAIERGLPLTPEIVSQMPRAHPRCGTNLLALSGLIIIIFQHLPSFDPAQVLFALLFIYFTWRSFGEILQNYFTTRPATRAQLESGIRAGVEVMEKYQDQPHLMPPFGARLLRSGMAYAAAGMIPTILLWLWLSRLLENWVLGVR